MAQTTFAKQYRDLASKGKLEAAVPKDSQLSYPVVVRREDRLYDGMFLFRPPEGRKKDTAPRPFGWVLLSFSDGSLALSAECGAVDFIPTDQYPLDSAVSVKLPGTTDAAKVKKLAADLMAVYGELREFAFEENLSRNQVAAIVRYKDLFMQLCPKGLYPFYHALSPPFFHWLRLPLPEQPAVAVSRAQEEPREYQYQLLILETLQQLVTQFQEKIAVDKHKEGLFDQLHKEVQSYKSGMLDDLTRHMELDVVSVIDGLDKTLEAFVGAELNEDAKKLLAMLEGVATDLRDILYRQGIDPFTVPGGDVDVSRQTVVSTVPTKDPARDRKVCARLAGGWIKNGRVVRPERISVYLYGAGTE